MGGGFETALSSDVVIAEKSARLGFPEILFNLFPGMGAYSLLERRVGMRVAEELILSGKMMPAYKLHEMGVVDVLAPNGQGESTVRKWIADNAKSLADSSNRCVDSQRRCSAVQVVAFG